MPASAAMDSVAAALKHNFKPLSSGGASSPLETGLASSAKKSLLSAAIKFDAPVRQLGDAICKGSSVILLNPKRDDGASGKQNDSPKTNGSAANGHAAPAPTKPKVRREP